ncbi:MAG: type IV-A pilus assembly ATPase PilB [Parcubacteria group bacterium]|nr:type IV-A pilus assembly ATPase PilB [Parcubacteria group bacterium]
MSEDSTTLGELLVREELVSLSTLQDATEEMRRTGESLHDVLSRIGDVNPEMIQALMSRTYGIPTVDEQSFDQVEESAIRELPMELCEKHGVFPLSIQGDSLIIAVSDPTNIYAMDDLKFLTGYSVEMVVSTEGAIQRAFTRFRGLIEGDEIRDEIDGFVRGLEDVEYEVDTADDVDVYDLERQSQETPIVRVVNLFLIDAIMRGVSDIHIEPGEDSLRVRYRLDGVLQEVRRLSSRWAAPVISRIKVMSQLDITERRRPQDGRIKLKFGGDRECAFRVSVAPFHHGEKIVLRLLDASNLQVDMTKLGFDPDELVKFQTAIHQPFGMVLVVGPTGSGKTTTLYSALTELNKVTENISTAEDPIEFDLPNINQMQMREEVNLNFAQALRSFLRQDPDIIMVGEIRDFETVEIAVKAAQTGRLVLSTLHTNDAPSTITRLTHMGVEAFLVADTVSMIVAQRLVRRTCSQCREPHMYDKGVCLEAGMSEEEYENASTMKGGENSCHHCNGTGLRGRVAVYEILEITDHMREAILGGFSGRELKMIAVREGMRTLRQSALAKFAQGLTTLEEVLRVTRAD